MVGLENLAHFSRDEVFSVGGKFNILADIPTSAENENEPANWRALFHDFVL